jgi:diadenylate cyclase
MANPKQKTTEEIFREAVEMVSPGTTIREAISFILQSGTGALLCFGNPKRITDLSEGGVKVDADTTSNLLYELSKMDGAILLNQDGSKILYANRFLKPKSTIPSNETGTRHRAAERFANQAKCLVVTVSERRSSLTLYVHDQKHIMDTIPTVLNRTTQILQTLERFMTALQEDMAELATREFQDMVTIFDVCRTIQRYERVERISQELDPHILELGEEGRLVRLQLEELTGPLEEAKLVVRDFYRSKGKLNYEQILERLGELSQEDLSNLGQISQLLGYSSNLRTVDTYLTSRGYRVMTQTHRLSPQIIDNLVERFGSLQQILRAPKDELVQVEGIGEVMAERIRVGLNLLQNQLALDRR